MLANSGCSMLVGKLAELSSAKDIIKGDHVPPDEDARVLNDPVILNAIAVVGRNAARRRRHVVGARNDTFGVGGKRVGGGEGIKAGAPRSTQSLLRHYGGKEEGV